KFNSIRDFLDDTALAQLANMRIAFLIDEIHRSNSGTQHEEMVSLFDELQNSFDSNKDYKAQYKKKNLIIGFTATPSDVTLARFGEFNRYAEAEKIWVPFDSYTMREAIEDGYILNPIKGIVPVSAKMYFEKPEDDIEGFEGDLGYGLPQDLPDNPDAGSDANGKKYRISKKRIYENEKRIEAISTFVAKRLVTAVYHNIRGTAKAMLAVSSIPAAIKYKAYLQQYFEVLVQEKKYERFEKAPIYLVYSSDGQKYPGSSSLNDGLSEAKVLQNFSLSRNGVIIVVDKLQTGFDEPRLHTLFLDKEIRGINAIQTISRVNRTTKYKTDCKIIDLSYKNVNVKSIKEAFEHFSNVVVSDFDPLGQEQLLASIYDDLINHILFETHFEAFKIYQAGQGTIKTILDLENTFTQYIRKDLELAKQLKRKINDYFKILNLIEFVIEIDDKYSEEDFTLFWQKFSNIYNTLNGTKELVDEVDVYFDNRIGIVVPREYEVEPKPQGGSKEPSSTYGNTQYKFDILAVIAKRNEEEEEIESLIIEFQKKIEDFFAYVSLPENGRYLIAKMKDDSSTFDEQEIYNDFEKIYKKFIRRNRNTLGDFFIKETKDIVNQLCDDFEMELKRSVDSGN
ncbi:MAG: type I restriction endonuclease subunit R, partial [Bacteroidota bacterium]|nr:type I restriction endonuclease subunit R [Bacteroidota bacterium]